MKTPKKKLHISKESVNNLRLKSNVQTGGRFTDLCPSNNPGADTRCDAGMTC
jgi:hypothetical protein